KLFSDSSLYTSEHDVGQFALSWIYDQAHFKFSQGDVAQAEIVPLVNHKAFRKLDDKEKAVISKLINDLNHSNADLTAVGTGGGIAVGGIATYVAVTTGGRFILSATLGAGIGVTFFGLVQLYGWYTSHPTFNLTDLTIDPPDSN